MVERNEAAWLRAQIGTEIERIEETSQLAVLQRLTLSSNSWLRQNAVYAVRHLHDLSSVFYLIRLIDDTSQETRRYALAGLAELPIPDSPLNGRQVTEQDFISRWRDWWQAEGKSKYGKSKS